MKKVFERFGEYVLLEKLAQGGMAEVFLAVSPRGHNIDKFLALKRILPEHGKEQKFIDLFKREARIAVQLAQKNIVSIFEYGVEKEQPFLVMDYINGITLKQLMDDLKNKKITWSHSHLAYILREVAAGLDYAHDKCTDQSTGALLKLKHRDISPQNIMISFEGEVKIIDFGIAKGENDKDAAKGLVGKIAYMSPEQASAREIDPRTDIFSLGIIAWEMIAQKPLFAVENKVETDKNETLKRIADMDPPPLTRLDPYIPKDLESVICRALKKNRDNRYDSADQMHRDLNRYLSQHHPNFSISDFAELIRHLYKEKIEEFRNKIPEYKSVRREPIAGTVSPNLDAEPIADQFPVKLHSQSFNIIRSLPYIVLGVVALTTMLFFNNWSGVSENGAIQTLVDLRLDSIPTGAEIFLDGKPVGYFTPGKVRVPANINSTITLKKPGYEDFEKKVDGSSSEQIVGKMTASLIN